MKQMSSQCLVSFLAYLQSKWLLFTFKCIDLLSNNYLIKYWYKRYEIVGDWSLTLYEEFNIEMKK